MVKIANMIGLLWLVDCKYGWISSDMNVSKNDFLTSVGIDFEIVIIFGNESNATVSQNEIVIFQRN